MIVVEVDDRVASWSRCKGRPPARRLVFGLLSASCSQPRSSDSPHLLVSLSPTCHPPAPRTQYQVRRARLAPPRSPSQLTGGHLAVGALCGKESHFSELSGAGHTLNESASSSTPLSRPAKPLGGAPAAADSERREAMLAAAEARSQSVRLLGFQARNSMLTRATGKQTRGAEWRRQAGGAARCSTGGRGTGAGSDRQGREDQGGPARGELSFRFDAMGEGC